MKKIKLETAYIRKTIPQKDLREIVAKQIDLKDDQEFYYHIVAGRDMVITIYDEPLVLLDSRNAKDFFKVPIEHLDLNFGTINILKKANINSLGEIFEVGSDIKKFRGFGEKRYWELTESLKWFENHYKIGFSLAEGMI